MPSQLLVVGNKVEVLFESGTTRLGTITYVDDEIIVLDCKPKPKFEGSGKKRERVTYTPQRVEVRRRDIARVQTVLTEASREKVAGAKPEEDEEEE